MRVELIKQLFDGQTGYKISDMSWCCDKLKENPTIDLFHELDNSDSGTYKELVPSIMIHDSESANSWGDEWQDDCYYRINYCPFCGELIEIVVVDEEDVSEEYVGCVKQRTLLWDKYNKEDSKRKSENLRRKVEELDKKIAWFHSLADYKKN